MYSNENINQMQSFNVFNVRTGYLITILLILSILPDDVSVI